MRSLLALLLLMTTTAAFAERLTLERLLGDPALSGAAPRTLKVAPDGARVTFLRGKADNQAQLDLWEYDVASGKTRLLVDSKLLSPQGEQLSDAEKARRERARLLALSGIIEYQFSPDGKQLLFPLNGELYLYDLRKSGSAAVRQLTHGEGFATDPKVSPQGGYVSFVRDRELWVIAVNSGVSMQLTHDASDTVMNGMPEFVADEEMDRHTGYWWAPDDSAIAFARVDESPVPIQRRFEIYADRTEVVEQRYPAAGQPNVHIRLGVVAPREGAKAAWIDLGSDEDIYLARVGWADATHVAFQRQSRDQKRLELVLADVAAGTQRTLLTETADTWVNLHDDLHFLAGQRAFLWSSERSGTRQLYLYDLDGKLMHQVSNAAWPIDAVLGIDEKRGVVYAAAPGPEAVQKHVFAYALDGQGEPRAITTRAGFHDTVFADDASVFVDTYSDADLPPQVRLHRANDGKQLAVLEANEVDAQHPWFPYRDETLPAVFGTLTGPGGDTLHWRAIKPRGFDAGKKYPVLVRVYGGPHVQLVQRAWDARWGLFDRWLAGQGYVVFSLDNRGSARRGKAFEDAIFHRMGTVEVDDQLAGVDWLAKQPWVDAQRIGVFGWSYGGYMTLRLIEAAPTRFAAAVAGAPVTDWALYDTHYTERYMGTPANNAAGYEGGSVLVAAGKIASPLLLIHGMADDNVLFTNSTKLMTLLQQRGQPFELMTYPGEKHGVATPAMRSHNYATIARFLARALRPAET